MFVPDFAPTYLPSQTRRRPLLDRLFDMIESAE